MCQRFGYYFKTSCLSEMTLLSIVAVVPLWAALQVLAIISHFEEQGLSHSKNFIILFTEGKKLETTPVEFFN